MLFIATATQHNSKAKVTCIYQDRTAEVLHVLLIQVLWICTSPFQVWISKYYTETCCQSKVVVSHWQPQPPLPGGVDWVWLCPHKNFLAQIYHSVLQKNATKISGFFMSFLSILSSQGDRLWGSGDTFEFLSQICINLWGWEMDCRFRDQVYFYDL